MTQPISPRIHEIIVRLMAKRPEERFASDDELLAALRALEGLSASGVVSRGRLTGATGSSDK